MALKVNEQSPQVAAMANNWPIAAALLGGTQAMRDASEKFLPKWPNEEAESYKTRLSTATLFPAFSRTLGVMAGKPFAKQLTFGEDVPKQIVAWCDDCDLEGRNLHTFASEMLAEALGFGLAGVLVDYPRVGQIRTLAEERQIGARPYLVKIEHDRILGWKTEKINGVTKLSQLRLSESGEVDDGDYGTKAVRQIRVLWRGAWELWEEQKEGEGYVLKEKDGTSLAEIPFVPFYGRRTGFMTGISPLLDLAFLNVKHWQSQSDQDTILHVARVPILAMIGAEDGTSLTVGASIAVKLPQNADLKFVEHGGAAIAAGETSLEKLQDQMIQTGAELLIPQPGQRSATEANNDAEANKSELQRIIEQFEDSLDQCLQFMADWAKLGEGGHVSVFKDFAAGSLSDAAGQLILSFQQGGLITKRTAISQAQRIGILSPDIDPDTELSAVADEGPPLGNIGNGSE